MKQLIYEYKKNKKSIKQRLKDFAQISAKSGPELFAELCFCLLTPQSKAVNCNKAIENLKESKLLFKGDAVSISSVLRGLVRFHNNKAKYLVESRNKVLAGESCALEEVVKMPSDKARDWLVKNIKGLGYKEASHYMRNIGKGKNIAIIDRHILNNLKKYRVIGEIPQSITPKKYLEIEQKMNQFSKKTKIPMDELDLLFWSKQTGYIFK